VEFGSVVHALSISVLLFASGQLRAEFDRTHARTPRLTLPFLLYSITQLFMQRFSFTAIFIFLKKSHSRIEKATIYFSHQACLHRRLLYREEKCLSKAGTRSAAAAAAAAVVIHMIILSVTYR
jgi:hypothetical protein